LLLHLRLEVTAANVGQFYSMTLDVYVTRDSHCYRYVTSPTVDVKRCWYDARSDTPHFSPL